jgi:hypothetical protein
VEGLLLLTLDKAVAKYGGRDAEGMNSSERCRYFSPSRASAHGLHQQRKEQICR